MHTMLMSPPTPPLSITLSAEQEHKFWRGLPHEHKKHLSAALTKLQSAGSALTCKAQSNNRVIEGSELNACIRVSTVHEIF
jgi:hypothetical protein